MSIKSYEELNAMQLDAMKEIGNIGSGNAAKALSDIVKKPVNISVPHVSVLEINEAVNKLGGYEKIVAGVMVNLSEGITGAMLSLQSIEMVNILSKSLMGVEINSFEEIDDMQRSLLTEIGNIMLGTYTNAVADLAGLKVEISVPGLSIGMLGGIITTPIALYCYEVEKILLIKVSFLIGDDLHENDVLLLPDVKSLENIFARLGV